MPLVRIIYPMAIVWKHFSTGGSIQKFSIEFLKLFQELYKRRK